MANISSSVISYDDLTTALPNLVRDWLGLRSDLGVLVAPAAAAARRTSLAEYNDCGTPFSTIADIVERGEVQTVERGILSLPP